MSKSTSETSFNDYSFGSEAYDAVLESTLGWMPEATAPYDRFVMALFYNHENDETVFALSLKKPAAMIDDTFKDEHWLSCPMVKFTNKPLFWTACHIPPSVK